MEAKPRASARNAAAVLEDLSGPACTPAHRKGTPLASPEDKRNTWTMHGLSGSCGKFVNVKWRKRSGPAHGDWQLRMA